MGYGSAKLVYLNKEPYWRNPDGSFRRAQFDLNGRLVEDKVFLKVGSAGEMVQVNK